MLKFSEQKVIDLLLSEFPEIELIYLFGSMATGKTHSQSDLDIAFWNSSSSVEELKCFAVQERLAALFSTDVDLVDMRGASEVFCYEVVTTGRRIYTKDIERMHFIENRIWSDYLYLNEVRRDIVNDRYGKQVL
ncbi:type VII toxin-antitoxin system MntA family adenylyltransferase antitoxin [Williamwhitmania taraxaci]|uniref:Nucleotidyltransferase domain-containing protein n=1 Tax=Williamwhitmania taraxaci TaxID=1640674 RepID=A0A1G6TX84_9BACT|nr:nucleotidyltransferase domain-containing protein [Williamwhitmania taraxaci]SDD33718.1 Nucleotidyltransferase domain-containing protein [Williamwhitmania taraxaci]